MYDFDEIIDRRGSDCVKYDRAGKVFGRDDVLPMWVADMDFRVAPGIIAAARECCDRGVFGYTFRSDEAMDAFIDWTRVRHGWSVEREWIGSMPGIITALPVGVRVFTREGDRVVILPPVYPPFFSAVTGNGRELASCPLVVEGGRYVIDWPCLEREITGARLLVMCNPHNPVGRAWTREELTRVGELCARHGVTILSDEIHADLALFDNRHVAMASLSDEIAAVTVTMMAPSKTFNIAGMMNSVIVIPDEGRRALFAREVERLHLDTGNIFGHVTMKAAYRHGGPWVDAARRYIEGNVRLVEEFLRERLPGVTMIPPEASFLLWLDFRGTGLSHEEVGRRLVEGARLGLNDGLEFGPEGRGFRRMNVGTPRAVVREAMERLAGVFSVNS
jgi:cystathionine beta-lyase